MKIKLISCSLVNGDECQDLLVSSGNQPGYFLVLGEKDLDTRGTINFEQTSTLLKHFGDPYMTYYSARGLGDLDEVHKTVIPCGEKK